MNELMKIENIETVTSLEIAEITKKNHKNILADIRDEISKLGEERVQLIFQPIEYLDNRNRKEKIIYCLKKLCVMLKMSEAK